MYKNILALLTSSYFISKLPSNTQENHASGKCAICILHPNNDSGVNGLVSFNQ